MASFRGHIAFGGITGIIITVSSIIFTGLLSALELFFLFLAVVLGSFLPDLDSDSSLPFHIIFGTFTLTLGGVTLFYTLTNHPDNIEANVLAPLCVILFTWTIVGRLFKKITHHRGIIHSFPAILIATLVSFITLHQLQIAPSINLIMSIGLGAGYLSHLILDELNALTNLNGKPFRPKKSLGTALKFHSSTPWVNILTYLILIGLASYIYIVLLNIYPQRIH